MNPRLRFAQQSRRVVVGQARIAAGSLCSIQPTTPKGVIIYAGWVEE
jgi:hypothetical protein